MTELDDLAARADRAMRTSAARNTAESAYALVTSSTDPLAALAVQRGWSRAGERAFVCSFGGRSSTLDIPAVWDAEQLARLITRTEVNVFLGGGADDLLLRELQALAQRELGRLFDEA